MTDETLTAEEQAAFATRGVDPAPAEQPAGQPEPAAQPDEGQPRDERGKFVPQGALHEERERRKAAETELRGLRDQAARFDERLRVIQEMQQRPAQQQPEAVPDLATDPMGYIRHLESRLNGVTQTQAQDQARQQQMGEVQRILSAAAAAEAEYRAKTPDYGDATAHLQTVRAQQLALMGYTPEQVRATIAQDSLALATQAARAGRNPAEIVYEMAKSLGYQPKAAATGDAERIATAARGQQLASSLGTGGQAPAGRLTAADLLKMSDVDFTKAMQTAEGRKLLGG